jgi:hypothetical protein
MSHKIKFLQELDPFFWLFHIEYILIQYGSNP